IGAHTVTHAALAKIPLAEQRNEIAGSKRKLESICGRSVTSFSYPYGRNTDYTKASVALVRAAGFTSACSNVVGVVDAWASRCERPRLQVGNWDGEELCRRLAHWYRAAV